MFSVKAFVCNAFEENTYVVSSGQVCLIIDPGCSSKDECAEIEQYINEQNLKPVSLINTHCHIDHVLGNSWVKERFKIPFYIHEKEIPVLHAVKVYAPNYGYPTYQEATPDAFINEGETVSFGDTSFQILFLPGHAPGHVGLYFKEEKKLFAGDVLFRESIGRTDLPGGDFDTLIKSIHSTVFTLPDEVEVFPGHGPSTTVGHEKIHNPFCGTSGKMAWS